MKPKHFKEAHVNLLKPSDMTAEECSSLWVYREDNTCISLWTMPFWDRLKFLFHGHIWLGILSGQTQPPVWLQGKKTIFGEEK
jgi:hypothetical protein